MVASIYHPLSIGGQGQDGRELFLAVLLIDARKLFLADVDLDDQVDENLVRMEGRYALEATTTRPSSRIPLFGPPPPHFPIPPLVDYLHNPFDHSSLLKGRYDFCHLEPRRTGLGGDGRGRGDDAILLQ